VMLLDGKGVPDLLVGYAGRTVLVEVKNPNSKGGAKAGEIRRKGRGVLKAAQVKSFAAWKGDRIHEVINVDEALDAIGMTGERYDFECELCGERCTTSKLLTTCGRCGVLVFPPNHTLIEARP
jgi:hypothetical protein